MSPRRRAPLSGRDEAAAEQTELLALRARLQRGGIGDKLLRQLLSVASMRGGIGAIEKIVRRSVAQRRRALSQFIERECAAHSELHGLLDDPLATDCHPKKAAGCSSKIVLVRDHFRFCRVLMRPSEASPRGRGKRLLVLPDGARQPGDVIRVLVQAGLNQREVAMLWLDHQRSKREQGVPLTKDAIDVKHRAVLAAASAHRVAARKTST